jgi:hypothetical protein
MRADRVHNLVALALAIALVAAVPAAALCDDGCGMDASRPAQGGSAACCCGSAAAPTDADALVTISGAPRCDCRTGLSAPNQDRRMAPSSTRCGASHGPMVAALLSGPESPSDTHSRQCAFPSLRLAAPAATPHLLPPMVREVGPGLHVARRGQSRPPRPGTGHHHGKPFPGRLISLEVTSVEVAF